MSNNVIEDKEFTGIDFTENQLPQGEYENCRFVACNLSNNDLSNVSFLECEFENSDLSMIKTSNTAFRDVAFKGCKILGVHFDECNKFLLSMSFEGCQLNLSSFYKLALKKTTFKECSLHEVDFTETDLSRSVFNKCNLAGAMFYYTILENADFRSSENYSIDPETSKIRKAKFSMPGVLGLLNKYDIVIE